MQDRLKNAPGGVGEGIFVFQLLVQVAIEDFGVARFIHHLRGAIELRINPRHCRGQLASHEDRQLLTVQELAQIPGEGFVP